MTVLTRVFVLLIGLLALSSGATAQKISWEEKPIGEWNEGDVSTILKNSPWGRVLAGRPSGSAPQIGTIVYESNALFTLRPSVILTYGVIRAEQLKSNYASMGAKAKGEFNKRLKPLLDCPLCEKFYIVSVSGNSDLLRNSVKMKSRAPRIYLSNDRGEKRELKSFTPSASAGGEASFYFERFDANGKPLLTASDMTVTFNFLSEPNDDPVINLIQRVEIKVKDIVRENQVIF